MSKLLVATTAALGIAAFAAPSEAETSGPRPAPAAEATTPRTLDHARRAWFEQAVDDILAGGDRRADQGGVLQGRSSNR